MSQEHNNIRIGFGVVVVVATILLNTLSLSAVQVDQSVTTDGSIVKAAVVATGTASVAVTKSDAAPVANEFAIPSPIHAKDGASGATNTPSTEAPMATDTGDGVPHAESGTKGSQLIIQYTYARRWGCFWYCTRIPYFCPCTVIYF